MARTPWLTMVVVIGLALISTACGSKGGVQQNRPAPIITEVIPSSGGVGGGTEITIRGTGLANDFRGGLSEVWIGGVLAESMIVVNDSEITCVAPARDVGVVDVVVNKRHGTGTLQNGFAYFPAPELVSINPDRGTRDGGQTVTIVGRGFLDGEPGEPLVSFASTPASFVTVIDDTMLEVLTPVSFVEKAVDLSVENAYGKATLLGAYTYVGPLPEVDSVDPNSGSTDGGETVTINGAFFTLAGGPLAVRFGGAAAVGVVRVDDDTLTCITPIAPVEGLVDIEVENQNGIGRLPNGFTFIAGPPTVSSLTPDSAPENTTVPITITGTGFVNYGAGTPTVTLGGDPVTSLVVVSDTILTCTTPGLAEGSYDLVVTNNRGSVTVTDAFSFAWIPTYDTTLGSAQFLGDDDASQATFGFSFPFYGTNYTFAYSISNGGITLGGQGSLFNYSGQFDSVYPQISPNAWDLNPSAAGDVYHRAVSSTQFNITYSGVPWFFSTGSITAQVQLRSNGSFAILWNNVSSFGGGLVVGISPSGSPSGGTDNVDWTTGPSVSANTRAQQSFSGTTWNLTGGTLVFSPDGSNGYTTRYYPASP